MSKNESRQERKKQNNQEKQNRSTNRGISNIYYWIIGVLFVILILLIVFIFSRSGNDVNLEGQQDQSELIQEENNQTEEPVEDEPGNEETVPADENEEAEEEQEDTEQDTEETNEEPEQDAEEADDNTDNSDLNEGEAEVVNEDAPLDSSHATDYSTGSADRVEIKERVMEVTGLGSDLIERWVGNDGPGRVVATVSSRDQTEHYEVYLQYGEGNWHVTSYERLSENPE